jgi:hypothetical protein
MPHPIIIQLCFTRSEFKRALEGHNDTDARRRFLPMNCIICSLLPFAISRKINW